MKTDIVSAMEDLTDEYPHEDRVDIWMSNHKGTITYTCYIPENDKFGLPSCFESGNTPMEAVEAMIKAHPPMSRDPANLKARRIAQLEKELNTLKSTTP